MSKKRIAIFILVVCLGNVFIGCGKTTENQGNVIENNSSGINQNSAVTEGNTDEEVLKELENATASGTVVEINDAGCTVVLEEAEESESEGVAVFVAPGADTSTMEKTNLVYDANMEIKIAELVTEEAKYTLREGTKKDIKKESRVYIYGKKQEDGTFLVSKMIVEQIQQ